MKCKLEFGDIITTENGRRWVYGGNDGALSETDILEKTYIGRYEPFISNQKIVKVERFVKNTASYFACFENLYYLKTIYEKKEILDEAEKRYLYNVIKPFINRVEYIEKCFVQIEKRKEYIHIKLNTRGDDDDIYLPYFKVGTMYKGMRLDKKYTLKELGMED